MQFLKKISSITLVLGVLAAPAVTGGSAHAQKKSAPASRSYDSIVAESARARPARPVRPMLAADGARFLVVDGAAARASDDGGQTWREARVVASPAAVWGAGGVWWLLGADGTLASSRDAQTWRAAHDLGAASGLADPRVVAGGRDGDDGSAWAIVAGRSAKRDLSRLVLVDGAEAKRSGEIGATVTAAWRGGGRTIAIADGEVHAAVDGGDGFERLAVPVGAHLAAVVFADERRGWIASADGLVLATRDGGREWLSRPVGDGRITFDAIGVAASAVWALGRAEAEGEDALFVSTDDGVTWRAAGTLAPSASIPVAGGARLFLVDGRGRLVSAASPGGPWRVEGAKKGKRR